MTLNLRPVPDRTVIRAETETTVAVTELLPHLRRIRRLLESRGMMGAVQIARDDLDALIAALDGDAR